MDPTFPTEPGSLIRATATARTKPSLFMRAEVMPDAAPMWLHVGAGRYSQSELTLVEILHDEGRARCVAVGFTGSRSIAAAQAAWIEEFIAGLAGVTEFRTGACIGVDEVIARAVAKHHPTARNVIFVPADRSRVSQSFLNAMIVAGADLEFMPNGTSYRDRNATIVENATELIGFPLDIETAATMRRSGTWQTIRMARDVKRIPTRVYCLSEVTS